MFADVRRLLLVAAVLIFLPVAAFSQTGGPCPRPAAGSVVPPPPELFSVNGVLNLQLNYVTTVDGAGRTLFCLNTPNGLQGPTLHVMPGDTLNVTVTNLVPAPPPGSPTEVVSNPFNKCGDATMTITSLNVHYHGTNTAPTCHSDEVIHTIINSGESFQYSLHFPTDEPPGLYWYHPHVHGLAEAAVQGGASGVIIVGGIANFQPRKATARAAAVAAPGPVRRQTRARPRRIWPHMGAFGRRTLSHHPIRPFRYHASECAFLHASLRTHSE
jgi:FtsP/CotA-like multicopper oxidase with cupredoxin domain